MTLKFLLFMFVGLIPCHLRAPSSLSELIIWNVGQGQWATLKTSSACWHFDAGGEFNPILNVKKSCSEKENYLALSHYDWDHISFARSLARAFPRVCLWGRPRGFISAFKQRHLAGLALCQKEPALKPQLIDAGAEGNGSNDLSRVFTMNGFLFPGDSTKKQEIRWSQNLPTPISGLLLGHHGSRTSSSNDLLDHLPNLKWTVVSARQKKYGHPHLEVILRLKKRKTPMLLTEHWGHIHFILKAHSN